MNKSKFNVFLYLDESEHSFFAAVYSAILMINMPNMYLTMVRLKESKYGSVGTRDNWLKSWAISPKAERMKDVMDIFSAREDDVRQQVIYCNPNIPDTVKAILDFSRKNSIDLIIIGTGKRRLLNDLIFGSLAHTLQKKSPIPILVVKKFTKDFFESYRSKPNLKVITNESEKCSE